MSDTVNLVNHRKRRRDVDDDIDLCIFCKKVKRPLKLSSSEKGIKNIKSATEVIKDDVLKGIKDENSIKYHLACYRPYILKGKRFKERQEKYVEDSRSEEDNTAQRQTRKSIPEHSGRLKKCIVCNKSKVQGDSKLYRICEQFRAEQLLKASRFYLDAVFQRTALLEDVNSVFAAGIHCHKKCIKKYIVNYQRDNEKDIVEETAGSESMKETFTKFAAELKFENKGYSIGYLRNELNEKYLPSDIKISNRRMKSLLIEHFGDTIHFTYSRDRSVSQMVFSNQITVTQLAEEIRSLDCVKECAETLRSDIKNFDFDLDNTDCNAKDIFQSFTEAKNTLPKSWLKFCSVMFPSYQNSPPIQLKCLAVFQILFYLLHSGAQSTPLHVGLAQTIHEMTRSKLLLQITNRLGMTVSYDALERHNVVLATRILSSSKGTGVPLPKEIKPNVPIRAAMDNFDHLEQTPSGIGGSHDTVLVIFQNESNSVEDTPEVNQSIGLVNKGMRSFHSLLPCQELKYFKKPVQRGEISETFTVAPKPNLILPASSAKEQDMIWSLCRYFASRESDLNECKIPTWSAFNSMISSEHIPQTKTAFTPILPHPATEFSSIYTCMKNFQDCLTTVNQKSGSLWSDEGVYRIAKEIQLLRPEEFSNIFLGLGAFHLAKDVMACFGKYLAETGVKNIFIETETFGPNIVENVLAGKHYSRAIRGFSMLAEALQRLLLETFMESNNFPETTAKELKALTECIKIKDSTRTNTQVKTLKQQIPNIMEEIEKFAIEKGRENETFRYWYQFLTNLFPILRDITRAQREGNWDLNISALMRSIPLFFAFDKTNYSRWASVFLEDCLHLPLDFPDIYAEFKAGHFVVKNTQRKFSCVAMDQALEQNYNKPAKGQGGIIGVTRRKEAVLLHDLIKHEKVQIVKVLRDLCGLVYEDEYTLHHEFSNNTTTADELCVRRIVTFMKKQGNPFMHTSSSCGTELQNVITKQKIDRGMSTDLLNCIQVGETAHTQFRSERFEDKSLSLMQPIKRLKKKSSKNHNPLEVDVKNETSHALRLIDISRCRGYDINHLLSYELTSTSLFLTRNGFLTKSDKSQLVHGLEKKLQTPPNSETPQSPGKATVIDFMAFARKVPTKSLKLKTYEELVRSIWIAISQASHKSERIDIVFDVYNEKSVKGFERTKRSRKQPVEYGAPNDNTPLPVDTDAFWASSKNKELLQAYFFEWISRKKDSFTASSIIYLGGVVIDGQPRCFAIQNGIVEEEPTLEPDHEEADDRILSHISHITLSSKVSNVVICSTDTDVFVSALYHYLQKWKSLGLKELWIAFGVGKTSRYIPLHSFEDRVPLTVLTALPAIHSLTGCDTTSKVSTKLAALKTAESCAEDLLLEFGKGPLNEDMEKKAEEFLVRALASSSATMDKLRFHQFHHKKLRNFQDLAPTSRSIRLHIKRSYLQCYKWIHALEPSEKLNPLDYGYVEEGDSLIPQVTDDPTFPEDFPKPCNCQTCFRETVCPCRRLKLMCCDFCKCKSSVSDNCKNPHT